MISRDQKDRAGTIDSDRWQRLKAILASALEQKTPAARTDVITQLCVADSDLLTEAKSLLAEAEAFLRDAPDDLEECANNASAAISREDPCQIGERVGAYVIVRKIGEGGMGTVYLAARADGYFEKDVAVKVLRRGSFGDDLLRRFQSEREALARLDHPNIARLIDAGNTSSGLPYLVMEYVEGTPVTRFVDEKCESIAERLKLFIKITSAVEAAHRNLVIHRDLKSTNILVNRDGEPKLLDFGIAKLVSARQGVLELTALGQDRFTPVSASPEQAKGERITVASDVYALGVVLYELLTGAKPLRFATSDPSREEVLQAVCVQTPLPPSLFATKRAEQWALRGDLDAIVLRALQKDPINRYCSVAEFAADITRYLASQPVDARRDDPMYWLRRLVFRSRPVRFTSAVVLTSVVCLSLLFWGSRLLNSSSKESHRNPLPARLSLPQSISDKSIAVLPFDSLSPDGGNNYFADGVQDDVLTDLAKVGDLRVISRTSVMAYRGAKNIGRIRDDLNVAYVLEGTAQKIRDRIRVNARLIDTRTETEVWAEQYDRTLDDLFAVQSELAQAIVSQLKIRLSQDEKAAIEGRPTQDTTAYELYLRARGVMRDFDTINGDDWRRGIELLEQAIARDPNFALAYCLESKGHILLYRYYDHTPERLSKAKNAAVTAEQLAPTLGEPHLAKALYYYHGLHDYAHADEELKRAAPNLSGKAEFLVIAQLIERRLGHWKEALHNGEKALSIDPRSSISAEALMQSYILVRKFAEVDKIADDLIAQIPPEASGSLWGLKCWSALAAGNLDKARHAGESAPGFKMKATLLATVAFYQRRYSDALRILEDSASKESNPIELLLKAQIERELGESLSARADFENARRAYELRSQQDVDDPNLLGGLALSYAGLGRKEEAVATSERAVRLSKALHDAIDTSNALDNLAEVYAWNGDYDKSLSKLAEVVSLPNSFTYGDLNYNPEWAPLLKDQRFHEILAKALKPPTS
jgi:serine/threonine protein kinase